MKYNYKLFFATLIKRINDDDIFALASQLAYSLIVSFFPFLIFLMTLIGFSSLNGNYVLQELARLLPKSVYDLVSSTILEVTTQKHVNLLSLSFFGYLWAASSGFRAVIKGINKAYNEKETRSFINTIIISIFSTIVLSFVIIIIIVLLVFGELSWNALTWRFSLPPVFRGSWDFFRTIIILSSLILGFSALYRYAPSRRKRWFDVLPGAMISTIGWLVVSFGFAYYVNNFANYSRIYGSIGAVFILLTWIYLISVIILLGGEINAVIKLTLNNNT